MFTSLTTNHSLKRGREDDDAAFRDDSPFSKRVRSVSASAAESSSWHDSVLDTTAVIRSKYDSDDQSSLASEPASSQDLDHSSADEMEIDMETAAFSQSPDNSFIPDLRSPLSSSPWRQRMQGSNRVPTPFSHPRPNMRPIQTRSSPIWQHVRQRHPPENGAEHLEVPSPIDEDEARTPPSAAEAAGSQLSMLSVNDMDVEPSEDLPSITIDSVPRTLHFDRRAGSASPGLERTDNSSTLGVLVPKQRRRSGAQSNGSASPIRASIDREMTDLAPARRGLNIGFRVGCPKCEMRIPGHMNHFIG